MTEPTGDPVATESQHEQELAHELGDLGAQLGVLAGMAALAADPDRYVLDYPPRCWREPAAMR